MSWQPNDPVAGSKYFRWEELKVSRQRPDLEEPVPDHLRANAEKLVRTILDPCRELIAGPLEVNSCYRSRRLNTAVGGSSTSQHRRAEAADITNPKIRWLFLQLLRRQDFVPCGQVIYYPEKWFMHIALPSPRYPKPSFHLHSPSRGWSYLKVRSVEQFDRLLPAAA